jgi:hypothetical protein
MPELQRPTPLIPLTLDRARHLRLDAWALWTVEQELRLMYGKQANVLDLFQQETLGMTEVLLLLWAALRHEDAALTLEQVGHLVDFGNFSEAREAVQEAFMVHVRARMEAQAAASPLVTTASPEPLTGPASGAGDGSTSG